MSPKKAVAVEMPAKPLKYRIPNEGPSPRESELVEKQRTGELTEAEAAELTAEQDSRTAIEAEWAEYRERQQAFYAAQARQD